MKFTPCLQKNFTPSTDALYFIFKGDLLYVKNSQKAVKIPSSIQNLNISQSDIYFIGNIGTTACYAGMMFSDSSSIEASNFVYMLSLLGNIEDCQFAAGCYAYHFVKWHSYSRFCGSCGSKTVFMDEERGKKCTSCGHSCYPVISPCIIVAVVKDRESILLGKINRPGIDLYSVLAGFVEMGETLEECVHREIFEEAGIEIENLRYFGSQPWAFSQSLMVAFTADHKSGTLNIDKKELPHADWFTADNLPKTPLKGTIARALLDWFIENHQ